MGRHVRRAVSATALVTALVWASAASAADQPWGFEQVTPVEKGGSEPVFDLFSMTGRDASGVVFSTRAAIGSTDPSSAPYSSGYLSTRRSEGWDTRALDIPTEPEVLGAGLYTTLAGVSRDLSHSLVVSRQVLAPGGFAGGGNLYRRNLSTDQYEFIAGRPEAEYFERLVNMPGEATTMVIGASDSFDRLVIYASLPLNEEMPAGTYGVYEWTPGSGLVLQSREDGEKGAPLEFPSGPINVRDPNYVSADGRRILLVVPGTHPTTWEPIPGGVFVRIDGERTEPISYSRVAGEDTEPVPPVAWSVGASANGRFIAFSTDHNRRLSDDAPVGNGRGLYLYDRDQPVDEQLRFIAASGFAWNSPELVQVTGDGTVYFKSTAALQPGATPGDDNIYVWRDGEIKLVVRGGEWGTYGEWSSPISLEFTNGNYLASTNGRYFAFSSVAPVTGSDNSSLACGPVGTLANLCREVFLYDADLGTLECASCPTDGGSSAGNANLGWKETYLTQSKARPVVTDGGALYFDTPNDLVDGDSNGLRDTYALQAGDLRLVSRGTPGATSRLLTVSDDGAKVFVITTDRIVGQDRDNLADVYVTGAGVGIPAQNPVEPTTACTGGDCRDTSTPVPPRHSLGSADLIGKGNAQAVRKPGGMAVSARQRAVGPQAAIALKARSAGRVVVTGNAVRKGVRALPGAGSYKVKVSLTPEFRKRLRDKKRLTVRVRVMFRPATGNAVEKFVTLTCVQPTTGERAGR